MRSSAAPAKKDYRLVTSWHTVALYSLTTMDHPRCRHESWSRSSWDPLPCPLPPCPVKLYMVMLIRCPGEASINHGQDASPTPDSSVVTLERNPESGVRGWPPYNEQTWDDPDFTRHVNNKPSLLRTDVFILHFSFYPNVTT